MTISSIHIDPSLAPEQITPEVIRAALSYDEYRKLMMRVTQEKTNTGPAKTEELAHYTALNWQRMQRVEKTLVLPPHLQAPLQNLERRIYFLIFTESWCGDAAQNIPAIEQLVDASPALQSGYLLRDENESLFSHYLTNGGKSIPKLAALDADTGEELFTWGPRPRGAQELVDANKAIPEAERPTYDKFSVILQQWYNSNRGVAVAEEIVDLITRLNERPA